MFYRLPAVKHQAPRPMRDRYSFYSGLTLKVIFNIIFFCHVLSFWISCQTQNNWLVFTIFMVSTDKTDKNLQNRVTRDFMVKVITWLCISIVWHTTRTSFLNSRHQYISVNCSGHRKKDFHLICQRGTCHNCEIIMRKIMEEVCLKYY